MRSLLKLHGCFCNIGKKIHHAENGVICNSNCSFWPVEEVGSKSIETVFKKKPGNSHYIKNLVLQLIMNLHNSLTQVQ